MKKSGENSKIHMRALFGGEPAEYEMRRARKLLGNGTTLFIPTLRRGSSALRAEKRSAGRRRCMMPIPIRASGSDSAASCFPPPSDPALCPVC